MKHTMGRGTGAVELTWVHQDVNMQNGDLTLNSLSFLIEQRRQWLLPPQDHSRRAIMKLEIDKIPSHYISKLSVWVCFLLTVLSLFSLIFYSSGKLNLNESMALTMPA